MRAPPGELAASAMELYAACSSALAREAELAAFVAHHGIAGLAERNKARLAENFNKAPFAREILRAISLPTVRRHLPSELAPEVARVASELRLDLEPGTKQFLVDTLVKRDRLIMELLERAGMEPHDTGGGAKTTLEAHYPAAGEVFSWPDANGRDKLRVFTEEDAIFVAVGPKGRHVLAIDWTTGFTEELGRANNRHQTTIAACQAIEHPETRSATVAFLQTNELEAGEVDEAYYDRRALDRGVDWLQTIANERTAALKAYKRGSDSEGTPKPQLAASLDAEAKPGDHCRRCSGAICCGKIADHLATQEAAADRNLLKATAAAIAVHRGKETPISEESAMTIDDLSKSIRVAKRLTEQLDLPKRIWEEGSELTRQLAAQGKVIPGWKLKEGARRLKVKASDKTPGQGVSKDASTPAPRTAREVYASLAPVLKGLSYEQFVEAACDVDPKAAERLLADAHLVAPEDVFKKILEPLAAKNPFEKEPNKPSVVSAAAVAAEEAAPLPSPAAKNTKGKAR